MTARPIRRVARALRRALGRRARRVPGGAAGLSAGGDLQQRADALGARMFLGGPLEYFELFGRLQLIALLRRGLTPDAYVLDIGCGALRAGYWLIHFLDRDRYLGIEPNREMLDAARAALLEPGLEEDKQPRFAYNDDFDLGAFGVAPRFVLARSIWTHAPKAQIERMLDSFAEVAPADGLLLASYLPVRGFWQRDYRGDRWVGRGPGSDVPRVVAHRFAWIAEACRSRALVAKESRVDGFGYQVWVEIVRAEPGTPTPAR